MARRIKVTQIITRLDRGGSSDMVVALCERLDRGRFDVTLITGPSADPAEDPHALARRTGTTVVECVDLLRPVKPAGDLRALLSLWRYLGRARPDVVHTHTSKAGALGRIAASLAGVPVVHSPHGHLFYGYYGKIGTGLVVAAERMLAALGEQSVAVLTDASRSEHLNRGIGRYDQFVTVPSGIDLERFRPDDDVRAAARSELGLGDGFAAGWAGRFARVKGPEIFIEACAQVASRLPDAVFVLAGEGELRAETEARAEALGLKSRCRFLGQRADMRSVLSACDLFVLSSRNEGLGLALVEAMACGTPVVAADVGGVREVLGNGRAGMLVPPDNAPALADAVVALATNEPRRSALVAAGLERAAAFSVRTMVERFSEIYEELAR